jgi:hypothetical protein
MLSGLAALVQPHRRPVRAFEHVGNRRSPRPLQWHHLVVTKSGAASKLYIYGIDRTGTVTNLTMINTASTLILGAKNGTSEFLAATIDEFAVYNAVLSGATVLDHYKAGLGTG